MSDLFRKYKTFIFYAIYGIPPTIISFGGYFLFMDWFQMKAFLASGIAWCIALIISFLLYRKFVFHSNTSGFREISLEFLKFTGIRITSGLMETGFVWLFVDFLGLHKTFFKIAASVLSALLNYTVSKLFIFKQKLLPATKASSDQQQ